MHAVSADEMRELDRILVQEMRIEPVQIAELAGRAMAELAWKRWRARRVAVVAGSGGNGAAGLAGARHLASHGVDVSLLVAREPDEMEPLAARQLEVAERIGLPRHGDLGEADLVVDAIFGYGLRGAPVGRAAALISSINQHPAPVLALDAPSGLDVTTGYAYQPCVAADVTLALGLLKSGLLTAAEAGELHLADMAIPVPALRKIGCDVPAALFAESSSIPVAEV